MVCGLTGRLTDVAGRLVEAGNLYRDARCSAPRRRSFRKALASGSSDIKYALGTKDQSLTFERGPNLDLSVYTDAN